MLQYFVLKTDILIGFIRPEQKFNGLDELKAQIARDCDTARGILADTDLEQFSGS